MVLKTMVYGTYNELVTGAFVNQLTTGGPHIVSMQRTHRPSPGRTRSERATGADQSRRGVTLRVFWRKRHG